MKKEKVDWKIVVTALFCMTVLEIYALSMGINGVLLTTVLALMAGIAGWSAPQLKMK